MKFSARRFNACSATLILLSTLGQLAQQCRAAAGRNNPTRVDFELSQEPIMESEIDKSYTRFDFRDFSIACLTKKPTFEKLKYFADSMHKILSPFYYLPCLFVDHQNSTYEVCLFKYIKSTEADVSTHLGYFDASKQPASIEENPIFKEVYYPMHFTGGNDCMEKNDPHSSEIRFICRKQNLILVDIVQMACHKIFVFGTKFICPLVRAVEKVRYAKSLCSVVVKDEEASLKMKKELSSSSENIEEYIDRINLEDTDNIKFYFERATQFTQNPSKLFELIEAINFRPYTDKDLEYISGHALKHVENVVFETVRGSDLDSHHLVEYANLNMKD